MKTYRMYVSEVRRYMVDIDIDETIWTSENDRLAKVQDSLFDISTDPVTCEFLKPWHQNLTDVTEYNYPAFDIEAIIPIDAPIKRHTAVVKPTLHITLVPEEEPMIGPPNIMACSSCRGYGLWAWGPFVMKAEDAMNGQKTQPCPECGASYNPSEEA